MDTDRLGRRPAGYARYRGHAEAGGIRGCRQCNQESMGGRQSLSPGNPGQKDAWRHAGNPFGC